MSTFDAKTKILFLTILAGVLVAVYFSYQKTLVERNYETFDSEAEIAEEESSGDIEEVDLSTETEPADLEVETTEISNIPEN